MAKRKVYEVNTAERYRMLNDLYAMIAEIKSSKEAANFIRDVLTPSESLMVTRRIAIAKMLLAGYGYEYISKKLKVGFNTINNVNRWLFTGFGGYLNEIKKSANRKERRASIPTTEWARIKKKYPAHFLIFNLIDKLKSK